MFKASFNFPDPQAAASKLQSKLLEASFKAVDAAGKVYEEGYRAAVPVHNPPGTYGSAGVRHHFINLVNAIGRRTLAYSDNTGAYSVIGVKAAPNNWRSLAPQGLWIEEGTEERWRKDGRYTGFTPAYHILRNIMERYQQPAKNTLQAVMKKEMEK